jgi:hypothetical protein
MSVGIDELAGALEVVAPEAVAPDEAAESPALPGGAASCFLHPPMDASSIAIVAHDARVFRVAPLCM